MGRLLAQGARTSSSALLQRYREILFYYTSEFQKTSVAIQRKKESAELLRGASRCGDSWEVGATGRLNSVL